MSGRKPNSKGMKPNGRGGGGGFAGIPRAVMDSTEYRQLKGGTVKLLLELARQYRGNNNGDLTVAFSVLKERGFNSKQTIKNGISELLASGLVVETRSGRFQNPGGRCALYAITWQSIDECRGKGLEVAPTTTAPRSFSPGLNKTPGPKSGQSSDHKLDRWRQRDEQGRYSSDHKLDRLRVVT